MFYKHNNFLVKNVKITMGTNLKKYIADMEDADAYNISRRNASRRKSDAKRCWKKDFESWLDQHRKWNGLQLNH